MGAQDRTSEILRAHFPTSYLLENAAFTMAKGKKIKKKPKTNNLLSLVAPGLHYMKLRLKGSWVASLELRESSPSSALPGFCVLLCLRR